MQSKVNEKYRFFYYTYKNDRIRGFERKPLTKEVNFQMKLLIYRFSSERTYIFHVLYFFIFGSPTIIRLVLSVVLKYIINISRLQSESLILVYSSQEELVDLRFYCTVKYNFAVMYLCDRGKQGVSIKHVRILVFHEKSEQSLLTFYS